MPNYSIECIQFRFYAMLRHCIEFVYVGSEWVTLQLK